jgi:CBS domain-containing protein
MTYVTDPKPSPAARPDRTLLLSALMHRTAVDAAGQDIGRLTDIIVRLRDETYPLVTGLVAHVGGREVYVPATKILVWDEQRLELASARLDLRQFARRPGEVLLRDDVLGHRLVDVDQSRLVTAHDVKLTHTDEGWQAVAVDIHPRGFLHRKSQRTWRDWSGVEALIGHDVSLPARARLGGLRRLKPAQLADLIEEASDHEQQELLSRVHAHPELEADVFEELEENEAGDLLEARTDAQVADVLSHMRSDDAADALLDLPQERRQLVLDLLPEGRRQKVIILLGYQKATAGGLMGVDYLSVPTTSTAADVLRAVHEATAMQPEALVVAYSYDQNNRLVGAVGLVALLQADPQGTMQVLADPEPVHVHPDADLTEITLAMADYNLLVLPVLDSEDRLIGVLTIDDILEAAITPEQRQMRA